MSTPRDTVAAINAALDAKRDQITVSVDPNRVTDPLAETSPVGIPSPARGGRVRFRTESGSTYELDYDAHTWARLAHHADSNLLRSQEGNMVTASAVVVGEPVVIVGPPFVPGAALRLIQTTDVVEIVLDSAA